MTKTSINIDGVDSLRVVLREYNTLHAQIKETARKVKPVNKRLGQLKKALLKHMVDSNLKKIQLPNKDLLVVIETAKKPVITEKHLKARFDAFFEDTPGQAEELISFVQSTTEGPGVKSSLKHYESDSYVEYEDGEISS